MLVLSRYKDQSIYIGDDIVVTIVDVRGDRIRLGVEAPANVPVHRQEIYEEIKRKKDSPDEPETRAKGSGRADLDRNGYTRELRAVRSFYAGATAVVFGGWMSASSVQRLEKTLNFHMEWLEVGYSEERLQEYVARPDVRLFIIQEQFCSASSQFSQEIQAAGKDVVFYNQPVLTAERLAKTIYSQVGDFRALAKEPAREEEVVEPEPAYVGGPLRSRRLGNARFNDDGAAKSYADVEVNLSGNNMQLN